MPYKAENWHALPHEQYFSKHRLESVHVPLKSIVSNKI